MHRILVIRLYFPLDAVHVSDYISPSSGATFISCTSHLVYTKWKIKSNHKNFVHLVGLYTYCKMMHGVYNVKLRLCLIIHHILEAFRCHVLAPNAAVVIIYHCHLFLSFYSSKLTMPRVLPTLYIVEWRLVVPDALQVSTGSVVN